MNNPAAIYATFAENWKNDFYTFVFPFGNI